MTKRLRQKTKEIFEEVEVDDEVVANREYRDRIRRHKTEDALRVTRKANEKRSQTRKPQVRA